MITLSDFQKLDSLEEEIKKFIFQRCTDYSEATAYRTEDYYKNEEFAEDFDWYEFDGLFLKVCFMEYRTCKQGGNQYYYSLPLDILFDPDFKEKMKACFEEEREKQRLALIEKRKLHEVELKALAEKIKAAEIEELKMFMKKYPEIVKEGI